jgi:protein-arginine kinase activator protein McsA
MEKSGKKCEKCTTAEANVWFSSVSGKGRVSKHRYCRECAKTASTIRQPPPPTPKPGVGPQKSLLDVVSDSLSGKKDGVALPETPSGKIKRLEASMKKAIEKEDYEAAAKLRDEIAVVQKSLPKKAT